MKRQAKVHYRFGDEPRTVCGQNEAKVSWTQIVRYPSIPVNCVRCLGWIYKNTAGRADEETRP